MAAFRTPTLLALGIVMTAIPAGFAASIGSFSLEIDTNAFRGENCTQCHAALRDHPPGPIAPLEKPLNGGFYDVIIVGGGLSGLAAAYELRDYRVLVLDKESRGGGKMRREFFGEHAYPVAGVYMDAPDETVQRLFDALHLRLQRISFTVDTLGMNGRTIPDWITGSPLRFPYPEADRVGIRKLQDLLRQLHKSNQLDIPIERSDSKTLSYYEKRNFAQWINETYGSRAAELANLYSRDMFGVSGREISAAAGLMFMASEFGPAYTMKGGFGAVSEALIGFLGPRISTGAYVWKVSQDDRGVTTDFYRNGRDYKARSRAVVLAVPSLITRRIVAGLSREKREALSMVRYSSYFLAPLKLKRVIWKDSFMFWTPGRIFTELTLPLPDNQLLARATEQILVSYAPMGESEGRKALLSATDRELVEKVLVDLDAIFGHGASEVAEARVIRWGHAMPIPYPGYLTSVRPLLARPEGRLFFAGVDTQLPCLEGAVHSGLKAGADVKRYLAGSKKFP